MPVFTATQFAVSQIRKQLKSSTINEWRSGIFHIMEYSSAAENDEVALFTMLQIELEGIMLSEMSEK